MLCDLASPLHEDRRHNRSLTLQTRSLRGKVQKRSIACWYRDVQTQAKATSNSLPQWAALQQEERDCNGKMLQLLLLYQACQILNPSFRDLQPFCQMLQPCRAAASSRAWATVLGAAASWEIQAALKVRGKDGPQDGQPSGQTAWEPFEHVSHLYCHFWSVSSERFFPIEKLQLEIAFRLHGQLLAACLADAYLCQQDLQEPWKQPKCSHWWTVASGALQGALFVCFLYKARNYLLI